MSEARKWTVIVGGMNACKVDEDGDLVVGTTINAVATYRFSDIQLQAFWEYMRRPEIRKIFDEFEDKVGGQLIALGTAYGLQKGKITEAEFEEAEAMKKVWKS